MQHQGILIALFLAIATLILALAHMTEADNPNRGCVRLKSGTYDCTYRQQRLDDAGMPRRLWHH